MSAPRGWYALAALLGALVAGCAAQPPGTPAPVARVAASTQALNALLAEHWEWTLRENPEFATILGDPRYNDRWSDVTLAGAERQRNELEAFLVRFEAIDVAGLAEQDRLNRELMIRQLRDGIRAIDYRVHLMPIEQIGGLHLQLPQFATVVPTASAKDYEDYLTRLKLVPALFQELEVVMRQGVAEKLMPPRVLLEKTVKQCDAIAKPAGMASPFAQPVAKFPADLPPAEQERLRAAIVAAIDQQVRPAYRKLGRFIAKHYAPHGRKDWGVWALPKGDELYRFAIEQRTTTSRSPEEIHQLGLEEVARIEAEQARIAQQLGYKDLRAMRKALAKDPKVHATSRQQILDLYRHYTDRMEQRLPELFGLLPKSPAEIHAVEEYREKEAAGAQYQRGTPDGRRPGRVYVNTGDFATRPLFDIETTAYHEGVPGHHMQISIAQTLPGLPPFRQTANYTAYIEGWALYSERLGREIGFLQEPLSYYGHLDAELLRANRLVLDTGVHFKRWTRQQMVDWFRAHSAQPDVDIQAETDRYIVWPGQALAYKLGQLKILELRDRAKAKLGARFDIRAFHDHILSGGALPLNVLESRFNDWLATQGP